MPAASTATPRRPLLPDRELDEYVDVAAAPHASTNTGTQGTADAIYQNIYTIEKPPHYVPDPGRYHIYKMDTAT